MFFSVDVLLRVYAKCIDGQREIANRGASLLFASRTQDHFIVSHRGMISVHQYVSRALAGVVGDVCTGRRRTAELDLRGTPADQTPTRTVRPRRDQRHTQSAGPTRPDRARSTRHATCCHAISARWPRLRPLPQSNLGDRSTEPLEIAGLKVESALLLLMSTIMHEVRYAERRFRRLS